MNSEVFFDPDYLPKKENECKEWMVRFASGNIGLILYFYDIVYSARSIREFALAQLHDISDISERSMFMTKLQGITDRSVLELASSSSPL